MDLIIAAVCPRDSVEHTATDCNSDPVTLTFHHLLPDFPMGVRYIHLDALTPRVGSCCRDPWTSSSVMWQLKSIDLFTEKKYELST